MLETRYGRLLQGDEAAGRPGNPSSETKIANISIAGATSKLLPAKRAARIAKKAGLKQQPTLFIGHAKECDARLVYWPYWIGEIQTEKERPLFKPRRITYYIIGDAVSGGHALTRAIPKCIEHSVPQHLVIPFEQDRDMFQHELDAAQKEEISKLFIFGPPVQRLESVRLHYCPLWEVGFFSKSDGMPCGVIYVNAFNGTIKI